MEPAPKKRTHRERLKREAIRKFGSITSPAARQFIYRALYHRGRRSKP